MNYLWKVFSPQKSEEGLEDTKGFGRPFNQRIPEEGFLGLENLKKIFYP